MEAEPTNRGGSPNIQLSFLMLYDERMYTNGIVRGKRESYAPATQYYAQDEFSYDQAYDPWAYEEDTSQEYTDEYPNQYYADDWGNTDFYEYDSNYGYQNEPSLSGFAEYASNPWNWYDAAWGAGKDLWGFFGEWGPTAVQAASYFV